MNRKFFMWILLGATLGMYGCRQADEKWLNGEIHEMDTSDAVDKDVIAKHVPLEGEYAGMIAVYDSLLVCWEPSYQDHLFAVFNVDTGKEIGYFCPKGQGPNEFSHVNPLYQFLKKEDDVVTLISEGKSLAIWNLTASVRTGETAYDTILSLRSDPGLFFFHLPGDTLLSVSSAQYANLHEMRTPYCEKLPLHAGGEPVCIPLYKQTSVRVDLASKVVDKIFNTMDALKPDGTKLVQAMSYLPQLNIIDTRTGQVVAYREEGGPDYSLMQKDVQKVTRYHTSVQADDKYIYATYWGKKQWDGRMGTSLPTFDQIHVYDWEGHLVYKLHTDQSFFITWLDTVRNRLYTRDWNTGEIYYLDLNELGL